jgi:hypothetical protein
MNDVLSQGGDRELSPWPRRLAVIAVLAVLAVVVGRHLPRGQAAPAHRAMAVAAGPVQLAGLGSGAAGLLDEANGIIGPALPWAGSLRLPVTGQQLCSSAAAVAPRRYPMAIGAAVPAAVSGAGWLASRRSGRRRTGPAAGTATCADADGRSR